LADFNIVTDDPIMADWGWYIPIRNDGFRLALCCGHQDGDDDQFVCFTDPTTSTVKKLFRKIDVTAQLERLTDALHEVHAADPDIYDLVWAAPR
jgi:hypothetical protein